jgi:hypothetical protein
LYELGHVRDKKAAPTTTFAVTTANASSPFTITSTSSG